jgi:hypothetical protein
MLKKLIAGILKYGDKTLLRAKKTKKVSRFWRPSKTVMTKASAKGSSKWAQVKKIGVMLDSVATTYIIFDLLFGDEETAGGLGASFKTHLEGAGIDIDKYDSFEELCQNVPFGSVLRALLNSGAYPAFIPFFKSNTFELPAEEADIVKELKELDDDFVDVSSSDDDLGYIGETRLMDALEGHAAIKEAVEQLDQVKGLLGLPSREHALKLITLLRPGGVDIELAVVPGLETI